jgi:hypothetical protein
MSKSKMIEYRLDGVIAIPATCADAEKKLLSAIVAVVEAMGGQAGGKLVHRLTAEDYKALEAELANWSNGHKPSSANRSNGKGKKNAKLAKVSARHG